MGILIIIPKSFYGDTGEHIKRKMYHSDRGGVERDAIANSFCYEASSGVLPSGKLLQNSKLLLICDDPICVVIPLIQVLRCTILC